MTGFCNLNPEISLDFGYFSIHEQLKFHAQLSWAWKKFYNLEARSEPTLLVFSWRGLISSALMFATTYSQTCLKRPLKIDKMKA